jgi:hypothetical protein
MIVVAVSIIVPGDHEMSLKFSFFQFNIAQTKNIMPSIIMGMETASATPLNQLAEN